MNIRPTRCNACDIAAVRAGSHFARCDACAAALAAEYDAACADLRAAHQGADDGALLAAMRRYHAARFALGQRCICDVRAEDPDVRHRLGCSTQGRPVVTVREVPRG